MSSSSISRDLVFLLTRQLNTSFSDESESSIVRSEAACPELVEAACPELVEAESLSKIQSYRKSYNLLHFLDSRFRGNDNDTSEFRLFSDLVNAIIIIAILYS